MTGLIMFSLNPWGGLSNNSYDGGSVARAKAARVSIIRLTHNIWMTLSGESLKTVAPMNTMNSATAFTVS